MGSRWLQLRSPVPLYDLEPQDPRNRDYPTSQLQRTVRFSAAHRRYLFKHLSLSRPPLLGGCGFRKNPCLGSTRSALYEVTCYTFPGLPTDPRLGRTKSEDYREAHISFRVLKE